MGCTESERYKRNMAAMSHNELNQWKVALGFLRDYLYNNNLHLKRVTPITIKVFSLVAL